MVANLLFKAIDFSAEADSIKAAVAKYTNRTSLHDEILMNDETRMDDETLFDSGSTKLRITIEVQSVRLEWAVLVWVLVLDFSFRLAQLLVNAVSIPKTNAKWLR